MARVALASLVLLFLSGAEALVQQQTKLDAHSVAEADDTQETLSEKNRPVSKVVNLLKDIVLQLEKEGEEDEEVYQQMGCWCTTNDKLKTQEVANGNDRLNELTHAIEEHTANSARLNAELGYLKKEFAQNEEALGSATALRKKQLAEFNMEEKDMILSITSLKSAVVALSKNHEASAFLQESSEVRRASTLQAASLRHQLKRYAGLFPTTITPDQQRLVQSFLQAQGETRGSSWQPQSGEIFGILKAMKESFETNLAQSQKEETENNNAYEDLKKAKDDEIVAGGDLIDTKIQELASTNEKNAQAKQDIKDTRNTLAANTEYLANLQGQCQNIDHEYEARTAARQLEIAATSKALQFLNSDEAHDLFSRTFNFIQTSSSLHRAQRSRVMEMLSGAAKRSRDPRLSALSVRSRADAFGAVRKNIQDMVDTLTSEKEEEIKKKDYCIETITEIDSADLDEQTRNKQDALAAIDTLKMSRDKLLLQIQDLQVEIVEAEDELKKAGLDREKANQEFKVVVADQRATQKLLAAALKILASVYDKAALVQLKTRSSQGPPPPPGFKTAEKSAASGGVMGMIQSIIDDAKQMEKEAVRSEKESQEEYGNFVTDTNVAVDALNKDLTNKREDKAKTETDEVQRQNELEEALDALEENEKASKDIHYECDFLLKNFETRQSTRDDEIESLNQALMIFSGATFGAFLQYQP